jgi:hypothetical protein
VRHPDVADCKTEKRDSQAVVTAPQVFAGNAQINYSNTKRKPATHDLDKKRPAE